MIKTDSNAITARAYVTQVFQDLKCKAFKLQEWGSTAEPPPSTQTECRTCVRAGAKAHPVGVVTSSKHHGPDATVELFGRVNEADIFVGEIWVMALIITGAHVSSITQDFCGKFGYDIHPVK